MLKAQILRSDLLMVVSLLRMLADLPPSYILDYDRVQAARIAELIEGQLS